MMSLYTAGIFFFLGFWLYVSDKKKLPDTFTTGFVMIVCAIFWPIILGFMAAQLIDESTKDKKKG